MEQSNAKLQDNSADLNKYIDQSQRIENLERENRTMLAELDYFK